MNKIELTQGKYTIIDDEDYKIFSKFKWCVSNGYAVRRVGGRKNQKTLLLHREIMKTAGAMDTDHINGDKLDNRRSNLRVVTRSQNMANVPKRVNNKSGYKGVSWKESHKMWRSTIKVNGKSVHLGYSDNKVDASKLYNIGAIKYFGEYALLNNNG